MTTRNRELRKRENMGYYPEEEEDPQKTLEDFEIVGANSEENYGR